VFELRANRAAAVDPPSERREPLLGRRCRAGIPTGKHWCTAIELRFGSSGAAH